MYIDMWYKDKISDVDGLTVTFYPNEGVYRGNLFIKGRYVGDYSTSDSCRLEKMFPQLNFNWG